jgi:glutamate formiminotransferase
MATMKKIIECVPNFSEGRDSETIEKIIEPFRGEKSVKLLDYQTDEDHNRMVVTVVGEPDALKTAIIDAIGRAINVIDMRTHQGQHPRMGATDVVPFIPIKNISMEAAVEFSKDVAKAVAKKYSLDFGPQKIHPSAGVAAMGARMPLVAYNVNLDSNNIEIANEIAKKVRHISGGLRYCKGIGIELKDRGLVQVSMNMTDYTRTSLYQAFELIKVEARRYGVNVIGSEIVGLVPMQALMDTAAYYLGLENFSMEQVLEARIWE